MNRANYLLRIREDGGRDTRWFEAAIATESDGIRAAFERLLHNEETESALSEIVRDRDGPDALPRLFYWLARLDQEGQLEYRLVLSIGSVRVLPQRAAPVFQAIRFNPATPYRLSRFAFVRREGDRSQLESPLTVAVLRFDSWLAGAVSTMFAEPASAAAIAERFSPISHADVLAIAELLVLAGFLEEPVEDIESAESLWDFHEWLFHHRSSVPRLGQPFAGLHVHRRPEPPVVAPVIANTVRIALPPPAIERWAMDDPPLGQVMETRRSASAPGARRLTLPQLSDFLSRTARPHTDTQRVLPSAGGRHELEFYVVVRAVDDLSAGLYHYHASMHGLHDLRVAATLTDAVMARATAAWSRGQHTPDVVIVVAARFARMASRYAAIAYRNTLLDAGVAIEAMYLNGSAMGLAPCALGINLPELFARMTGFDPFEQTPVAMFALSGS